MLGGLADPVLDGQRIFRGVLDAMAHPGRIVALPAPPELPPPLIAGTAAIGLALLDFETPLWLDRAAATPEAIEYLRFHCGVPIVVSPSEAAFALIADPGDMPPLESFSTGTDEYPDRSATLIVQVKDLRAGMGWRLAGPGIRGEIAIAVEGVPERLCSMLQRNNGLFPMGVDLLLTAGCQVVALPRTTRLEA